MLTIPSPPHCPPALSYSSPLLSEIPGVQHYFGTLQQPLPRPLAPFMDPMFWAEHKPSWEQVHGTALVEVTQSRQECGTVDALWSRRVYCPVAVVTADCVPLLLADVRAQAVVAVHAGWRGTLAQIACKVWAELEQQGFQAKNFVAALGPAIGPCCYVVSQDLFYQFHAQFPAWVQPPAQVEQGFRLDLRAIQAEQLRRIGFAAVEVNSECTCCTKQRAVVSRRLSGNAMGSEGGRQNHDPQEGAQNDERAYRYHSYRRQGQQQTVVASSSNHSTVDLATHLPGSLSKQRQLSVIALTGSAV